MRVSIITVVKNHSSGLRATYQSLAKQSFTDWEMKIVVGDSKDDTRSVAKEIGTNNPRIQVIEQKSSGIYAAMNLGLAAAAGDFIWFMNAGDRFTTSNVLGHAINELSICNASMVIGGYQIDQTQNPRIYSYSDRNVTTLDFAFTRRGGCHQAMIFRTRLLKDIGGFDVAYSLAGDFDLVLKVIKVAKAKRVSEVYASIEPGGRADQGIFEVHRQKHQIRRESLGGPTIFIASLLWTTLARLKILSRRIYTNGFSK